MTTPADEGIAAARHDVGRSAHQTTTKIRPFECMECGKKLTLRQAEKAVFGNGCPRCGGADIDESGATS